ncbi:MAG TPA: TonB-dependent receptor [Rhizomicrobium sp.]|jgi:iron complex outermembrane receptor protein
MNKRLTKFLMAGVSPVFVLMTAGQAFAQSTGTQAVEDIESVTITAETQISGIMKPITVPKERSTITQDYINTQPAGQSIFDALNKVPGFNFTNNDPYGNSGGDVRIHGFDGNHISFTWDGMPLNDTGNYAIYTNQVADEEIIGSASVNQGTTDVDSPTAAATGGVVSIVTSKPKDDYGVMSDTSLGSYNYRREFLRLDTGAFGPWGTTAFFSGSFTYYNKFKGPGYEQKQQFNGVLYQDLGDRGWIQFAMHWNSNRNDFYNNPSFYPTVSVIQNGSGVTPFPIATGYPSAPNLAYSVTGNFTGTGPLNAATGFGLQYDEQPTCTRVTPTPGKVDSDASCSSFYGVRINPSDTGNLRLSSLIHLTDDLSLTFDPSLQYVLANGGGYTSLAENDPRLIGSTKVAGVDLNGDGDVLDTVGVYSPSNTNTIRYGLNTSLVWRINQDQTVQFAYTGDFGFHRQTGQMGFLGPQGYPLDPFGGYRDIPGRVLSADGTPIRSRDRRSHAFLNQVAFAYQGNFWDDKLQLAAGVRSPFLTRDLNQLCYEQVTGASGSGFGGIGFPTCTSAAPTSVNTTNNTVTLPGSASNLLVAPAKETVNFNRILPNAGFVLTPFGPMHQLYADYAAGLAAPRTDNLYNGGNNGLCTTATGAAAPNNPGCVYSSFSKVNPETSVNFDIGYRYTSDMVSASITGYNTQFKNRIVTSFDQEQGISIDRNIGSVNVDGVDAEADVRLVPELSIYTSASYAHSRVSAGPLSTIQLGLGGASISIAGKTLVETPDWTVSQRYEYKLAGFTFGLGYKYVGSRFATDANDYKVPSYTTVDGDVTFDLGELGWKDSYLKVNASNLLNARYLGSISSKPCFIPTLPSSSACGSYPTFVIGSPQVFQVTLRSVL